MSTPSCESRRWQAWEAWPQRCSPPPARMRRQRWRTPHAARWPPGRRTPACSCGRSARAWWRPRCRWSRTRTARRGSRFMDQGLGITGGKLHSVYMVACVEHAGMRRQRQVLSVRSGPVDTVRTKTRLVVYASSYRHQTLSDQPYPYMPGTGGRGARAPGAGAMRGGGRAADADGVPGPALRARARVLRAVCARQLLRAAGRRRKRAGAAGMRGGGRQCRTFSPSGRPWDR